MSEQKMKLLNEMSKKGILPLSDRVELVKTPNNPYQEQEADEDE